MTRECGAEADADTGPVGVVLGATLGAAVGGAVDERRLAVGLSVGLGATDDPTVPDADEATTIEIGNIDEARARRR